VTPVPVAAPPFLPGKTPASLRPIRLMIVDDSAIARTVLTRMLSAHRDLEVAATAANAVEALAVLRKIRFDAILLDVEMPGTSGLEALPDILRLGEGARVLIISSLCEEGAEATVKALALGAADTLPKPGASAFAGRFSDTMAERVRRLGRVERGRTGAATSPSFSQIRLRPWPDVMPACLALGASTGGLHALGEFLRALPRTIDIPILVTQHLPQLFLPVFARQIEAASGRAACVARDGDAVDGTRLLLAPGDAHIGLENRAGGIRVRLDRHAASSNCMPSVDVMLAAAAEHYGSGATGLIFSGMGRDGLVGAQRIADAGGAILVQDRATSAVWGMPGAVAQAGLASAILAPRDLAARLAAQMRAPAWS